MGCQNIQSLKDLWQKWRSSRVLLLIIVFVALFLDNMLLTVVVPIMPNYLYQLQQPTIKNDSTHKSLVKYYLNFRIIPHPTQFHSMLRTNWNSNVNWTMNKSDIENKQRAIILGKENKLIGIMFASKPFVQLLTNPFVGPLTNRIGYSIPMFSGFVIMIMSTLIFAFSKSFAFLFIARAIQGVGAACSSVSGLGMLADRYPEDEERGKAMGIALSGLALGMLAGPPFGGFMYEYVGKASPFLVLASLGLFGGLLQLTVLKPSVSSEPIKGASLITLLKDPYILLAAGALILGSTGITALEPSLPIRMILTMRATEFQQGAAFLPSSISYLIGTNFFGSMAYKMGRGLCCMIGLFLTSVALIIIPMATSIYGLIIPTDLLGIATGMIDTSMMPAMGYLVDIRHVSVYGNVYVIADMALCLSCTLGPILSAFIVPAFGFHVMLYIISFLCLCYAPLLIFLRNPLAKEEKMSLTANENQNPLSNTRSKSLDNENDY